MKKNFIDHKSLTHKEIKKINSLGGQSLIVVQNKNIFKGILSSFDLRKAIMNKNILNKDISKIYNKKTKIIFSDEIEDKFSEIQTYVRKLRVIPVIDRKTKKVVKIINLKNLTNQKLKKKKINCSVVIMAGGKGVRLRPYTNILPKPLLPINQKPAIKHILEKFENYSPSKFYITINYKSELLKSYFEESKMKFNIELVKEKKPLGTAGSLYYLKNKIRNYFFLTNCDTIINTNYYKILQSHIQNKNDITIVVAKKILKVPYGVAEFNSKKKFSLIEKPKLKFDVNVGLYILNKSILLQIKTKKFLDFNTLLNKNITKKKKIGFYQIRDKEWIDVGQMEKYKYFLNKKI